MPRATWQLKGQLTQRRPDGSCCLGFLSVSYNQYQAVPIRHYVNQTPSVYVMDNWHVTPRLTLQLGLPLRCAAARMGAQQHVAQLRPGTYHVAAKLRIWNSDGSHQPNRARIPDTVRTVFRST